ncbi:hypothetical protein BDV33DRAFT_185427 [Aspergillus novoparasiticus]|uniref:Uncharacterized protein n=1 Tax=Aspergillus novoparasiticus TaxID=986946 RepID=A0A5N6E738_9EURO|nr:hypothetical protein BDV33DRAFT_185427 [Aspergillus novoparasiticus]
MFCILICFSITEYCQTRGEAATHISAPIRLSFHAMRRKLKVFWSVKPDCTNLQGRRCGRQGRECVFPSAGNWTELGTEKAQ